MKSILSTKKLTSEQKNPFLETGFDFTEHDFIAIEPVDFGPWTSSGQTGKIENAIFTSQNAVKAIQNSEFRTRLPDGQVQNCFCVGEKTKKLLEENGMNVIVTAEYGKELAGIIVKEYPNEHFVFFCGNRRRDELPAILKKNKISFEEIEVYKTILSPKRMEQKFDGILFFSPSGVESFCLENNLKNSTAFCIGKTTAAEAKKYTDKIIISKKTTIESLVCQAVGMEDHILRK